MTTHRPIAFVLTSTHHGSMLVNRHDYRQTQNAAYGVGYQLLNFSCFDPEEVSSALDLLDLRRKHHGDGVVALDCGANIGVHTLEWAKHMHGWGEVMAFEAQERVFYALAGNLTLNNCFNARAVWAAVGETTGVIPVPMLDYLTPSSFGSLEIRKRSETEFIGQAIDYDPDTSVMTQLIALDDLGLSRVDFIKIDIEGMEMDALNGAQQLIETHRPIMLIEKIKSDEQQITAFLEARGYMLTSAGINLIAVHKEDPVRG